MDARTTEFAVADAKARFSELLDRAEAGEEIVIRRHGKAVARLVAAREAPKTAEDKRRALDAWKKWRAESGPRLQPGDSIKGWINEGRR
ncbi:type II toxin-antitoxin system Phd/YefM family antitoxin [Sphingomonas sp. ID0503]|uniref:type II toxin-antitoxin system Phd/YefM family antitoxin n=1 Tax=Sphingomonas sp. ID0503 TaxID=3399691 RepID=UPI003AFA3108